MWLMRLFQNVNARKVWLISALCQVIQLHSEGIIMIGSVIKYDFYDDVDEKSNL